MQSVIRKLPNHVIDRIKAGEVVERPMSVVKELVENALDAGATQVWVELVEGGRKLIRVVDNGSGMGPEDLEAAVERHATSKLPDDDAFLSTLPSFGFRGEALPSVGAVSQLTLRSRRESMAIGHELQVLWGEKKVPGSPCAMAPGTEVLVENLFERVPARLKFLKSPAVEMSHVAAYLNAFALAYPHVGFSLKHNGRALCQHPPAPQPLSRLLQIFPEEGAHMVPLTFEHGRFSLTGFVGLPQLARPTPHFFVTFANGRLVKDRLLKSAVMQGYTGFLAKGLFVPAVIFATVPPDEVDVNAHPCKTELRFTDPLALQDLVGRGVSQALRDHFSTQSRAQAGAFTGAQALHSPRPLAQREPPGPSLEHTPPSVGHGGSTPQALRDKTPLRGGTGARSNTPITGNWAVKSLDAPPAHGVVPRPSGATRTSTVTDAMGVRPTIGSTPSGRILEEPQGLARAIYLGQFQKCYLLLQYQEELWVVDQHAFHERVLYEELQGAAQGKPIARQALIMPITLPLGGLTGAVEAIEEKKDLLGALGFDVQGSPDGLLRALQVPAMVPMAQVVPLLEDLIVRVLASSGLDLSGHHPLCLQAAKAREEWPEGSLAPEKVYHLFYATIACHSAVRAGESLDAGLVQRLLERGAHVDLFSHCPHGRPVLRAIPLKEVEGWFHR